MSKKGSGPHLLRLGPYPSFRAPCRISLSSPPYRGPVGAPSRGCVIKKRGVLGVAGRHNSSDSLPRPGAPPRTPLAGRSHHGRTRTDSGTGGPRISDRIRGPATDFLDGTLRHAAIKSCARRSPRDGRTCTPTGSHRRWSSPLTWTLSRLTCRSPRTPSRFTVVEAAMPKALPPP